MSKILDFLSWVEGHIFLDLPVLCCFWGVSSLLLTIPVYANRSHILVQSLPKHYSLQDQQDSTLYVLTANSSHISSAARYFKKQVFSLLKTDICPYLLHDRPSCYRLQALDLHLVYWSQPHFTYSFRGLESGIFWKYGPACTESRIHLLLCFWWLKEHQDCFHECKVQAPRGYWSSAFHTWSRWN